jgi:branched-chain amino acid transport system ATP-binding protein
VLRAEKISVRYGAVVAVREVTLALDAGEVLAVLGPNGAGKTSLLRAISGLARESGAVNVGGTDISTPEDAIACAVIHVPQGRGLFRKLTVQQNLALVAKDVSVAIDRIPELREWTSRRVGSLSGGEQVLVALGRLIAARPRFALVDELSLGLAPIARDRVEFELRNLRDEGVGIVVVEQHAPRALDLADRVLVMEHGTVVVDDRADRIDARDLADLALGAKR